MTKQELAAEFMELREQMNALKRREKVLREFFIEDLAKYGKRTKKYGPIRISMLNNEREAIDLETLYMNYPDLYEKFMSVYTYTIVKAHWA